MSVEQRLLRAFGQIDEVEPSSDLWSRVLYSIEEDRQHRRRVVRAVLAALSVAALVTVAVLASLTTGPSGTSVRWQAMEIIETAVLVTIALILGPAISRFGRGYAADLWRVEPALAAALLRLLDVAYGLVLGGFILMTAKFEPDAPLRALTVAVQLDKASERVGGLLLIVGLLHGTTLMTLPLVALVSNSTRRRRRLPRFVTIILVIAALGTSLFMALAFVGLLDGSSEDNESAPAVAIHEGSP
jgi:hypothetical protein